MKKNASLPQGPYNMFARFIGPNPSTSLSAETRLPRIHETAFVSPFSSVIGDVKVKRNVYIAPNVSIRADEGTPFLIGAHTNIQDSVILHGLKEKWMTVGEKAYSIYIGREVTCAHGALVHGPCVIEDGVFIGFKAIVYYATVGEGAFISTGAVVTNGVTIPANRFVPPGAHIDSQKKADSLAEVPKDQEEFALQVQRVNQEFPAAYSLLFGKLRCSCGLACDC